MTDERFQHHAALGPHQPKRASQALPAPLSPPRITYCDASCPRTTGKVGFRFDAGAGNLIVRGAYRHVPVPQLTRGCVASISRIEVGEASRRRRIVVKEPATPINANDNMALAA